MPPMDPNDLMQSRAASRAAPVSGIGQLQSQQLQAGPPGGMAPRQPVRPVPGGGGPMSQALGTGIRPAAPPIPGGGGPMSQALGTGVRPAAPPAPGGGLAAEGFTPRPPAPGLPPPSQPGGGMAAQGFGAPRPPMGGGPGAFNMRPQRPPQGQFGQMTKAPSMSGGMPGLRGNR